jgi:hypothetical protein
MVSRSNKHFLKLFVSCLVITCLVAGTTYDMQKAIAAPATPGGMGGGPVCPPACPPNPTNCDANLVITPTQPLRFGLVAAPAAGTVTVDTTGARTSTGGVILVVGGSVNPATFSMSTTPYNCSGRALVIVDVATPAVLTHAGSGSTMTVDTFTTTPIAGDAFDSTIPLTVGGTLNVGTLQTQGTYNGNIFITVTFQ